MFFINRIHSWAYVAFAILIKRHNTRRKARLKYNRRLYARAMKMQILLSAKTQIIRPQSLARLHLNFRRTKMKRRLLLLILN